MSPDYDDSYSSGFYRMEMFGNYELRSMDLLVFMFLCLAFRAFQKKSVHESPFAGGEGCMIQIISSTEKENVLPVYLKKIIEIK